ncbi:MAG: N-acetylmuramoyl-L-alanine amidase [Clostridia bacterium]
MKQTVDSFVIKRAARLRVCVLLVLIALAGGMRMQQGEPSVKTAAQGKAPLAGYTIAIDPGHGGYDGGARARDSGIWEKALTLPISLKIEKELLAKGAAVVVTRREDVCLCKGNTATLTRKRQDLQKRVDIALEAHADVFLSIHLNEYRSRGESGPQVFYQRGGDAGRLLAGVLQQAMVQELKPAKKRVAMSGNYYVLRSALPSALVECGFVSNAEEEKLLLSEAYQQKIAEAVTRGVCDYFELLDKISEAGGV